MVYKIKPEDKNVLKSSKGIQLENIALNSKEYSTCFEAVLWRGSMCWCVQSLTKNGPWDSSLAFEVNQYE